MMSVREKVVIRILLMIAMWIAPEEWRKEINSLASHISVHVKEGNA